MGGVNSQMTPLRSGSAASLSSPESTGLYLFLGSRVLVGAIVHHLSIVCIPDVSICLGPVMILQSC